MGFDNFGFSDEFDSEENPAHAFTRRYRASISQTREEQYEQMELSILPPVFQELARTSAELSKRHPVVNIKMTNQNLETLLNDFKELTRLQLFVRTNPEMMHEFQKFLTWTKLCE